MARRQDQILQDLVGCGEDLGIHHEYGGSHGEF